MRQANSPLLPTRYLFHSIFLLWVMVTPGYVMAATHSDYMAKFAKARLLAEQGNDVAASRIYQALIKQDPLEPQAYNNLAAIRARHGQLKQARILLERALRSNPVYATVYQNLSAIYVEMARDSYGKALHLGIPPRKIALRELTQPSQPPPQQLAEQEAPQAAKIGKLASAHEATDQAIKNPSLAKVAVPQSDNAEAKVKLDKLAAVADKTPEPKPASTVMATPAKLASTKVVTHATSAITAHATEKNENAKIAPSAHTPKAIAAKAAPLPSTKSAPLTVASVQTDQSDKTNVAAQISPDKPQNTALPDLDNADKANLLGPPISPQKPAAQPVKTEKKQFQQEEVVNVLQGWAQAWSGKAVNQYLSFYTVDYAPSGMSHQQWVVLRRQRLAAPKWIHVRLNDFKVGPVQDGTVRVRLIQRYQASNYHDLTRKEFRLRHTADGWRIYEERTLARLR